MVDRIKRNLLKLGLFSSLVPFLSSIKTAYAKTSFFDEFVAIKANSFDKVTVPAGFNYSILCKWGDLLWDNTEKKKNWASSSSYQKYAMGDNNDGMYFFHKNNINLMAVNNEYSNIATIYSDRNKKQPTTSDEIRASMYAHGVSIFEVKKVNGRWQVQKNSFFNRKITPFTKMSFTGPGKGSQFVKTKYDPNGLNPLGTWNNCSFGKTPWGTYLTCEENFNFYFSSSNKNKINKKLKRYSIKSKDRGYNWFKVDERFDITKEPNEPNRVGYIVEIDPWNPQSVPKKHTALGRFKHENAEVVLSDDSKVVVYMGDDEKGEYIYKYVSNNKYDKNNGTGGDLLENGRLYVAHFEESRTGKWIELNLKNTGFDSLDKISIFTRDAATNAGATPMDRPEWIASNPFNAEIYCSLTNNKNRGIKKNLGGKEMPNLGPNPREKNQFGQIIKIIPGQMDHESNEFKWEIFALAGNPQKFPVNDLRSGSKNINENNMFNSPDGLVFNSRGDLFIQTDGNYSDTDEFSGMGNNQMLVARPNTKEIKRFLVGPKECEITGLTWSGDKKTMFVGIQHPGESSGSNFPDFDGSLPKSCIIAIEKNDNSVIG